MDTVGGIVKWISFPVFTDEVSKLQLDDLESSSFMKPGLLWNQQLISVQVYWLKSKILLNACRNPEGKVFLWEGMRQSYWGAFSGHLNLVTSLLWESQIRTQGRIHREYPGESLSQEVKRGHIPNSLLRFPNCIQELHLTARSRNLNTLAKNTMVCFLA